MYAKLFASLYQGTMRGRSDEILVFTNLLAHADMHGVVDKHFNAIADETGISLERVKKAIEALESPDPESRSLEMGGCRIVKIDKHRVWGWKVVNHAKYRAIRHEEDRREQNRLAQERWRNKQKISKVSRASAKSAHTDTDTDTDKTKAGRSRGSRLPQDWNPSQQLKDWATKKRPDLDIAELIEMFKDHWVAVPGSSGSKLNWDSTFRNWVRKEKYLRAGKTDRVHVGISATGYKCRSCGKSVGSHIDGQCGSCWEKRP